MRLVLISASVGLLVALLGTPLLIRFLRQHGYAQAIRVSSADEPYPEHEGKRGTPSMGGLAILAGLILGYAAAHLLPPRAPTISGLLALYLTVGLGLVGMADDYLKIFKQRSTGVRARTKLLGQAAVALSFAWMAAHFPDSDGLTPASHAISFLRNTGIVLPTALLMLWIWFLVTATTNAVNLTDGLDGLAIMPAALVAAALGVFAYASGNAVFANYLAIPQIPHAGEVLIFCGALAGAGLGFLWFNSYPAQVFMGDIGALAIGAAIGVIAVIVRQEIVALVMGGVFVLETASVILQVASFKLTGKRIFRMAPIHHHFELKGWAEPKVIVRFWIISLLLVLTGLATLKLR